MIRVDWLERPRDGGDSYGYQRQSLGTLAGAVKAGLVDDSEGARIAVATCSPARFHKAYRDDGRKWVLHTNWEAADMFPEQVEQANWADLVVVISRFNVDTFTRYVRPPVEYAPLAVERDCTPTLREQPRPGEPFRWLWLGAPSHRKGWDLLFGSLKPGGSGGLWHRYGWSCRTDVELYAKWSQHQGGGIARRGSVVYDTRRLSRADLLALYRSAHGFILPSYGEGFGLTLAEAMASGCPCIFNAWGGVLDFAEGWPAEHETIETDPSWPWTGGLRTRVSRMRLDALDARMREIMADYPAAAARAVEIGRRVYDRFSWEATGRMFVDALERHFPECVEDGRVAA